MPRKVKSEWSAPPVLTPREPGQPGPRVRIAQPVIRLGRDPGCDVVISEATVSRRHAEVKWDGHELVVEDLGSSGGTFVNDVRVQHAVVQPGDVLRLGPRTEYQVRPDDVSTPLEIAAEKTGGEEGVRHLQMLLDVARALNAATVLEEVVQIVLQSAVRLVRADRGCVILIESDGSRRTVACHPPDLGKTAWAERSSLFEKAIKGRQGGVRGSRALPLHDDGGAGRLDGSGRAPGRDPPADGPRRGRIVRGFGGRHRRDGGGEGQGRQAVRA